MTDHAHSHPPMARTPLIIAAAVMIAIVLALTTVSRLTGFGAVSTAAVTGAETLSLQFRDEADGGVGAYDAATGAQVFLYEPETGGFVRTALRALALDRRKAGVGSEPPFELARTAEGQFLLHDPETGQSITLNAFGQGNANEFAKLFELQTRGAEG